MGVNMKRSFKKAAAAVCSAAMALFMTGCMHIGIDITVNPDGTANAVGRYAVQKDYYSDEMFEGTEHEIQTFTIDGDEYLGYEYTSDYATYDELAEDMTNPSEQGDTIFNEFSVVKSGNPFVRTYTFNGVFANLLGEEMAEEGEDAAQYEEMANSMFKIGFTMKLPGKVKSCTGGTVGDDGVITFEISPCAETVCSAVSQEVNIPLIAGTAAAVVVIIAVIAVVAVKSKKKSEDKSPEPITDPDDEIIE